MAPRVHSPEEIHQALTTVRDWELNEETPALHRTFTFTNFHETMAFVNALAWVAHSMDHHPDFSVGYKTCSVHYSTHSAGGVTELDLEAARRVNALLDSPSS